MTFLRKLSIRSQLLMLAASAVLVILVIIYHSYTTMSGVITRSHEEYVEQTISEIKRNVTSNKDVLFRIMQTISYDPEVQSYLVETDPLARFELFKKLNVLLSSQKELKDGILDIVIAGDNGLNVDINGGGVYADRLNNQLPGKVNAYYVGMQPFGPLYGTSTGLVFATTISYVQQGERFNDKLGTLYFIISPRALVGEREYATKQTNTQIYLLDRYFKVITSNTDAETGSSLPEMQFPGKQSDDRSVWWQGKQFVVQTVDIPAIDASIMSVAPKNELLRDLAVIRKQELIILAIGLLLLAIPFVVIINNILRPLKKMILFMTTVQQGGQLSFGKRLSLKGYMEISTMAYEFNRMLGEIESLSQKLLETNTQLYGTELARQKSELAFLRSQINPHFLYNTLEAITGMAAVEGQDKIKKMTRSLSSIFRYSVKGTDVIELQQELLMIKSYVQIQQIRFADRFEATYRFTDDALKRTVPKMILQPLVENAVYHGIETTLKRCSLEIAGFIDEAGTLVIEVKDDGVGMEAERLMDIRAMLAQPPAGYSEAEEMRRSIGMVNVNNRIRLMFGQSYGMEIDSELGQGTLVRLRFGQRREDNHV
ncbi:sensor histidine kinase [Paenibacillus sp. NPDC058071]|uniref:sensor histidine kinase n=1 Tax=Paenibacillus sp. NPDC058071 TaxID=3346326 RepID=UPI0036DB0F5D